MKVLIHPKRVSIVIAILVIPTLGLAQNVPAQSSPIVAQPTASNAINAAKSAFFSMQQVIATCDEGKDESARFRQWAEKRQTELQALQKELDTLKNQLDVQGAKLTEEARNDLVDTIDAKEALLQRSQQESQKEADKRQQRLTDAIYRKVMPVIAKLAKEKNLDCVFFIDQNRDAYINPSLLITDDIIKAYNAAYPVNAGQSIKKQ